MFVTLSDQADENLYKIAHNFSMTVSIGKFRTSRDLAV